MTFHRWRNWQLLAQRIPIAVVMRPGTTLAPLASKAAHRLAIFKTAGERNFAVTTPPALSILDARRSPASATAIRGQALARMPAIC
jgi:nicotinate-nucleotide adenylyltransferase